MGKATTGSETQGDAALRILIVALNYAPELVGCAKYTTELAEDLAARGHAVEVVCGPPYYPQWKVEAGYSGGRWSRETRNGVTLHRTPLYVPARPSGARRVAHLASFGLAAIGPAVGVARRLRPDLVLAIAPALTATGAALLAARAAGSVSWLHVQDFEVDAAFDLGLLRTASGRRWALGLERRILKAFDRVSSISPAMVSLLGRKGVPVHRSLELRNWVDVEAVSVLPSSDTGFRRELGIAPERVVALYSGNMAAKQGIEMLGEVAARAKAADAPITFLLCGDGSARGILEARCAGLDNVRFLPLQPMARLSELLGTADIHLLPQRPEAADLVLPSKLAGMLASGRPVVAMAAEGSGLAAEVEGCGLLTAASGEAMAEAVLRLAGDAGARQAFGRTGRLRAEERWRKASIIDDLERRLRTACAR
jgi:colanic acid biosynthesis glycosyl transferase WcaI